MITPELETFWRVAAERQRVYRSRLAGQPPPWTTDPVLTQHRFTNVFRAADRVSQYAINEVIYNPPQGIDVLDFPETFLRTMLFKLFNRISTWEALVVEHGTPTLATFDLPAYTATLDRIEANGRSVFTGAYLMIGGKFKLFDLSSHAGFLQEIVLMIETDAPQRVLDSGSSKEVYEVLRDYRGIGEFVAHQLVRDLGYGPSLMLPEDDFIVTGTGSLAGSRLVLGDGVTTSRNVVDGIRMLADRQTELQLELGLEPVTLWGRPLQLVDIEHWLCETFKYIRIRDSDGKRRVGRLRPFAPTAAPALPQPWFPPHWQLNDRIQRPSVSPGLL
jgi:hypothetical protein